METRHAPAITEEGGIALPSLTLAATSLRSTLQHLWNAQNKEAPDAETAAHVDTLRTHGQQILAGIEATIKTLAEAPR